MLTYSPNPTFRTNLPKSPLLATVTDALGKVPIVRLNRIHPSCQQHHLYLKLLGASTGAIVAAALADTQRFTQPQTMLLLNPDRGDRYLETVYNADWLTAQGINILEHSHLTEAIANLLPVPLDIVGRSQE
ncbi:hypothetical protein [Anabaena sp. AL93]|uniref:hypothetical protein n=1 Tax=Anabaena sp. AL93 TaxID=1678133 RepID=UPI0008018F21|nr:hypothetical protein [Anabaena sp. AL93]OBQ18256.1 MAG: hypothetical protein AN486_12660 [Anabaena sp. AL93]